MSEKKFKYPADWIRSRNNSQKISVVTVYDASMAALASRSSVDAVLVGDSLSMTVQKNASTLPVTLDEMIYHTKLVRRGAPDMFVIGDLPFGSYHQSAKQGIKSAVRLMKETGASAVKLEGASKTNRKIIQRLVENGTPVMGHIGLIPQSYLNIGGYRVQGKDEDAKKRLLEDAHALEDAGCFSIVMEYVSEKSSEEITNSLKIPTIGIGSGAGCSGQVQVWNDLLGLDTDFRPKHAKRYREMGAEIIKALDEYSSDVKNGRFPGRENSF